MAAVSAAPFSSTLRKTEEFHSTIPVRPHDIVCSVRRGVRNHQDLETVSRIIQRQQALERLCNLVLLVVRWKGDANGRPRVGVQSLVAMTLIADRTRGSHRQDAGKLRP